jgi:hypothetical protein
MPEREQPHRVRQAVITGRPAAALLAVAVAMAACGGHTAGGAPASPTTPATPSASQQSGPVQGDRIEAELSAVAAASAADAWAVGSYTRRSPDPLGPHTLIEHWNGTSWKQVRSPVSPDSSGYNVLRGVAAVSPSEVWTAGTSSSQYVETIVDRWNGRTWQLEDTPSPGGVPPGDASLSAVAADSPTDTWAVGNYTPGNADLTLVEHWKGHEWFQVPSPSPGGLRGNVTSQLVGVAAVSPSDVWAVGSAKTGKAPWRTVIEHWDGTSWTVVPSPDPARGGCASDQLVGVAASAQSAWAVGDGCGTAFVLRLENGQWQIMPGAASTGESLAAVAVTPGSGAWIVGSADDHPLIRRWNGTGWTTVPAPSPAGMRDVSLSGVTVLSASSAWAVGQARYGAHGSETLVERWDGTSWTLVPSPSVTPP